MKQSTTTRRLSAAAMFLWLLPASVLANIITFDFGTTGADAWLTMLNPTGEFFINSSASTNPMQGARTEIQGTLVYDTGTGKGNLTVVPISFSSDTIEITEILFEDIGSNQMLLNGGFNWGGTSDNPFSLVWDATGFLNAIDAGLLVNDQLTNNQLFRPPSNVILSNLGSAVPASDNTAIVSTGPGGTSTTTFPLGPSILATTTWDTTPVNPPVTLGDLPSGQLPLVADNVVDATNGDIGLGGSPMQVGSFPGQSINLDFSSLTVASIETSTVPLPGSILLLGSGLLGLISMARRKKAA